MSTLNTGVPGLTLRFARREDVALLLSFIRELAVYEKLEHEVVATESALETSLFGSRPAAEALVATLDGVEVGFAIFFHNFSTFLGKPGLYLEDLFVRPQARGRGVGLAVMQALARLAIERGCGRFEWWVLDWNEPALEFYRRLGAQPMKEWTVQRLTGSALVDLGKR